MDHFTHTIIRELASYTWCADLLTGNSAGTELRAITALPAPDPKNWAFSSFNDVIFSRDPLTDERVTPDEWIQKGLGQMQAALATI